MKRLLSFFFLTAFLFSCTYAIDPNLDQDPNTTLDETTSFERLNFSDEFSLEKAIEQGGYTLDAVLTKSTRSNKFVSLLNKRPKSSTTKSSNNTENEDELTYYEALGFDTLVPNPNFAALLNPDGELEVGSNVIKITPAGTYKFSKENEQQFITFIEENPDYEGVLIEDNVYKISENILLYKTFEENPDDYGMISEGNYELLPDEDDDVTLT